MATASRHAAFMRALVNAPGHPPVVRDDPTGFRPVSNVLPHLGSPFELFGEP
jgi:hypothetical protein